MSVGFKYSIEHELKYLDVNKNLIDWKNVCLPKKSDKPFQISIQKKKDLLYLLKQGIIQEKYSGFYTNN